MFTVNSDNTEGNIADLQIFPAANPNFDQHSYHRLQQRIEWESGTVTHAVENLNNGIIPQNNLGNISTTNQPRDEFSADKRAANTPAQADITGLLSVNSGVDEYVGQANSADLVTSTSKLSSTADLATVADVNHQSLLFSPYGWTSAGNNSVQTSNAGAYIKFRFNGSQAILDVDTSNQTSFPLLDVYVDGQLAGNQLWLKNATNGQIKIFDGGVGDHDVVVYFRRREVFNGADQTVVARKQQDWLTDAEHLRVSGIEVSGGNGFLANSFARSKTAVFFGDSITEGGTQYYAPNAPDRPANFPDLNTSNNFSYKTYAARLGDLLNVDYGQVGWSGSGWLRPANLVPTGNPPILDSWKLYNGQSSTLRKFNPAPDYVFINLGTNDGAYNVTDTAYNWLKGARQNIPGAEIFVIYPFNQTKNSELRQGIVRYLNDNPGDTKIHALNLGAEGAQGLVGPYIAEYSIDSVHPTAARHQQLAGLLFDKIKPILGLSSTTIESTNTASGSGLNNAKYSGAWSTAKRNSYFSTETNATYEVTFRGNYVQLFGNKDVDNGLAAISIDGGGESLTDLYNSNAQDNTLIYRSGNLGDGFHTIKVRATGQKNASSIGSTIDLGKLDVS
jgi:GDSL-like Lipase/Acylhydrolase family